MLKKLDWVHPRMEELGMLLSDPAVAQDQEKWRALMREHSQLEPLDQAVSRYAALEEEKKQAQMLLDEPDMEQMAREELNQVERQLEQTEREIQLLLLPKDPNEGRNVVMEIRGGAGGEEAALFGSDAHADVYALCQERHGYKTEMLEANMTELGGVKEAVFVSRAEGGVQPAEIRKRRASRAAHPRDGEQRPNARHRPATVAVLPEAEDVDIRIDPDDLRIDVYRASGHGGQYINKTDSAVRITHMPSGIVVTVRTKRAS